MNVLDIEKKWIDNFKHSILVNSDNKSFQKDIAYQLFYGTGLNTFELPYPVNFLKLFNSASIENTETDIEKLVEFLHTIGILINKTSLTNHLAEQPEVFFKLFKRAHDIFKTLANYGDNINVNNPFSDNKSDIFFFLSIEVKDSKSKAQMKLFDEIELPVLYKKLSQLPDGYENDELIKKLFFEIENTNKSFFITGKAGTGKSTFIHYFAQKTTKKVIMLAFTGIAAVNIGGQTIHSFLKFPIKPMLPEDGEIPIFKEKHQTRRIISKINTIVIDEVSMLRSDVLEAIDYSLRMNGGNPMKPFGGKQLIFVGDVFQLPPIVEMNNEAEQMLFTQIFKSEYFFDAPAYKKLNPIYFEFRKVHRQKDDLLFIELLDKVRVCDIDNETIMAFNKRHYPNYVPKIDEFVIFLTTKNSIAFTENAQRLEELEFTKFTFEADVEGEFKEDRNPTNKMLELKKRAQVILLKNDMGGKWVNGTIAKIEFISPAGIEIKLQDGSIHKLEKTSWENRKYKVDKDGKIVSEVLGKFTQYPIKLAWAITIHKSQGLTFDKVVIDMGTGAFVNGQTYTALSRCRSLKGIALKKLLRKEDIITDDKVINFHYTEQMLSTFQESIDEISY